jgi:2-polyprenyl-6-methoxyphenol hydroxylase-like FAD-dependent oxidoreductase
MNPTQNREQREDGARLRFDAIVIGGGVAGSCTAAALAKDGARVLLCESGLPDSRRLAGEFMHPKAVAGLRELGFLGPLRVAGAMATYGFAIFRGPHDDGLQLAYAEESCGGSFGLAIEHATLTRTLLDQVGTRPGVAVWEGARVQELEDPPDARGVRWVTVEREDGTQVRVGAPLVVAASGAKAPFRRQLGLRAREGRRCTMLSYQLDGVRLPLPGFGHVFLGGPHPILAYHAGPQQVRILFEFAQDLPIPSGGPEPRSKRFSVGRDYLNALPSSLRAAVEAAKLEQRPTFARVVAHEALDAVAPAFAIVGDAGGCAHPLTASGILYCVQDALRLQAALKRDATWSLDPLACMRALNWYEEQRQRAMVLRLTMADAVVDAMSAHSMEQQWVSNALWQHLAQAKARAHTIGLLSGGDLDLSSLLRLYGQVSVRAATQAVRENGHEPRKMLQGLHILARRNASQAVELLERRWAFLAKRADLRPRMANLVESIRGREKPVHAQS